RAGAARCPSAAASSCAAEPGGRPGSPLPRGATRPGPAGGRTRPGPAGGPGGDPDDDLTPGARRLPRVRLQFGEARIRTKVFLVLLLPMLIIVSLAGVAVAGAVRSASSVASVERLARFGAVLSDAVDGVQHERDAAAVWL